MGAFLYFGTNFKPLIINGRTHEEYTADDLYTRDLSYTALGKLLDYCNSHGVPFEVWPLYIGQDVNTPILPDLAELDRTNSLLRVALSKMTQEQVSANPYLWEISQQLQSGKLLFITH
jgi:hypothetical protein